MCPKGSHFLAARTVLGEEDRLLFNPFSIGHSKNKGRKWLTNLNTNISIFLLIKIYRKLIREENKYGDNSFCKEYLEIGTKVKVRYYKNMNL